jgi:hypothetical protein
MSSRDSYSIQSEETRIVTALSGRRKIHTILHHEGLRKNKKISGRQAPGELSQAIPLAQGTLDADRRLAGTGEAG